MERRPYRRIVKYAAEYLTLASCRPSMCISPLMLCRILYHFQRILRPEISPMSHFADTYPLVLLGRSRKILFISWDLGKTITQAVRKMSQASVQMFMCSWYHISSAPL